MATFDLGAGKCPLFAGYPIPSAHVLLVQFRSLQLTHNHKLFFLFQSCDDFDNTIPSKSEWASNLIFSIPLHVLGASDTLFNTAWFHSFLATRSFFHLNGGFFEAM